MIADRSAPGIRVTLLPDEHASAGEPWELADRVLSFVYEDCEDKIDKFSLQLDNFDLSLFDRIDAGIALELSWGYPGAMAAPRRGLVKKLKGFQTLTLEGQAVAVLMHQIVKTRRWEGVTRAEVVRQVAAENGYDGMLADVEDTEHVFDVVAQTSETDARLLRRLAAKEGFAYYIDPSGFHWHRRRMSSPPMRVFTWYSDPRGEVLSVNLESDLTRRAGRVRLKGRDPLNKTTHESASSGESARRDTLADVVEVVDTTTGTTSLLRRNATESAAPTSAASKDVAQREAVARFVDGERAAVRLSMQVVGDPALVAKSVVEVQGISTKLSGKYYVNEVKHTLGANGYGCDLKLTRDGFGRGAQSTTSANAGTAPQTGDKNRAEETKPGAQRVVETIDHETGALRLEYRNDGSGSGDPEAQKRR